MERKISHFLYTSADDCRISLQHTTAADLPVLRQALEECSLHNGYKTKALYISRRIKKLEKETANGRNQGNS